MLCDTRAWGENDPRAWKILSHTITSFFFTSSYNFCCNTFRKDSMLLSDNKWINGGIEGRKGLFGADYPDFWFPRPPSFLFWAHLFAISLLRSHFGGEGVKIGKVFSGTHTSQFSLVASFWKGFWRNEVHFSGKQGKRVRFFVPETAPPSFQVCGHWLPPEASAEPGCQCCLGTDRLSVLTWLGSLSPYILALGPLLLCLFSMPCSFHC